MWSFRANNNLLLRLAFYNSTINITARALGQDVTRAVLLCKVQYSEKTVSLGMNNGHGSATRTLKLSDNINSMTNIEVTLGGQDTDWWINDVFLSRTSKWGVMTGGDYTYTKSMSLNEFRQFFKSGDNVVHIANDYDDSNAWMSITYDLEIRQCTAN